MTLYPASDQREIYSAHGRLMKERAYRIYTDSGATTLATIYANDAGFPGAAVTNAELVTNQAGLLPQFHEMSGSRLYGKPVGFDGPITLLQPDGSANSADNFVRRGELVVNVMDYGAKGDNVTDDTAAFQRALTAAGPGGTVFVPARRFYCATRPVIDNSQILQGAGFYVNRDAVTSIGMHADYLNTANVRGSVIRSGVTSGEGIFHLKSDIHAGGGIRDLAIVGPGSGTSAGLRVGQHTPSIRAVLAPVYRNVLVCNFATGMVLHHVNEAEFTMVSVKGCTTAISCVDDVNDVGWFKLNIQRCTNGLVQESGGLCYANTFASPICQNVTNYGFQLRGFSHVFTAPYFELCGAGMTGANSMMSFAGASNCTVISPQKQGAGTYTIDIASGSNFNHLINVILSATMLVANGGTGSFITGNLDNGARITGANNRVAVDLNSATYEVPSLSTTSGSRPSLQHTNFVMRNGTGGQEIRQGSGSPEGVVTAPAGSLYLRSNPANASEVIYVKTGSGNTGWTAK